MTPEAATRLDAALGLAAQGFLIGHCYGVTPTGICGCGCDDPNCKKRGKHGGLEWMKQATQDPNVIRTRFIAGDPNYMAVPASGSRLLVVDEDQAGSLETLGDLPETCIVETSVKADGVRGRHVYGRLPDGIDEEDVPYLWAGGEIRVRGNGGVVGPHSRHLSGVTYDPLSGLAVGTLPPSWVRKLIASGKLRTKRQDEASGPGDEGWFIPEPGRHPWLVSRAGRLRRDGLGGQALLDGLRYLNAVRCRPPLPENEVAGIAAWGNEKSGDPGPAHTTPATLRFYSPVEVALATRTEPDWIVGPGLVAIGAITEIDGKVKAAGKTTLLLHMIHSVLDAAPFLGRPTSKTRVVYITEQSRQTFTDALRRAGLDGRSDELLILFREDIGGIRWPDVVAATKKDGYGVVIFDTIGKLAGIREENSAGEWSSAMTPLQDLAASGRGVVLARHDRKSGGDVGDSGRGSSQASGDVDIILAVRRPEGNQPSNRRVIESLSRYPQTPEKIVVELAGSGYVLLGSDEAVAMNDAREFLAAAIGREYRQNGIGLDIAALVELGGERVPAIKRTTIQKAAEELIGSGEMVKSGRGVRGDPFVYHLASAESRVLPELDPSSGGTISGAAQRTVPDGEKVAQARDVDELDLVAEALRIFGDDIVGGVS